MGDKRVDSSVKVWDFFYHAEFQFLQFFISEYFRHMRGIYTSGPNRSLFSSWQAAGQNGTFEVESESEDI